jgi:hypothetical protein
MSSRGIRPSEADAGGGPPAPNGTSARRWHSRGRTGARRGRLGAERCKGLQRRCRDLTDRGGGDHEGCPLDPVRFVAGDPLGKSLPSFLPSVAQESLVRAVVRLLLAGRGVLGSLLGVLFAILLGLLQRAQLFLPTRVHRQHESGEGVIALDVRHLDPHPVRCEFPENRQRPTVVFDLAFDGRVVLLLDLLDEPRVLLVRLLGGFSQRFDIEVPHPVMLRA